MKNKFFKRVIARSPEDLQFISAFCSNSKVKIDNIKYLKKNKIFLILLERIDKESNNQRINSVLKFEFIDYSKSKNINQNNVDIVLELMV